MTAPNHGALELLHSYGRNLESYQKLHCFVIVGREDSFALEMLPRVRQLLFDAV